MRILEITKSRKPVTDQDIARWSIIVSDYVLDSYVILQKNFLISDILYLEVCKITYEIGTGYLPGIETLTVLQVLEMALRRIDPKIYSKLLSQNVSEFAKKILLDLADKNKTVVDFADEINYPKRSRSKFYLWIFSGTGIEVEKKVKNKYNIRNLTLF